MSDRQDAAKPFRGHSILHHAPERRRNWGDRPPSLTCLLTPTSARHHPNALAIVNCRVIRSNHTKLHCSDSGSGSVSPASGGSHYSRSAAASHVEAQQPALSHQNGLDLPTCYPLRRSHRFQHTGLDQARSSSRSKLGEVRCYCFAGTPEICAVREDGSSVWLRRWIVNPAC